MIRIFAPTFGGTVFMHACRPKSLQGLAWPGPQIKTPKLNLLLQCTSLLKGRNELIKKYNVFFLLFFFYST